MNYVIHKVLLATLMGIANCATGSAGGAATNAHVQDPIDDSWVVISRASDHIPAVHVAKHEAEVATAMPTAHIGLTDNAAGNKVIAHVAQTPAEALQQARRALAYKGDVDPAVLTKIKNNLVASVATTGRLDAEYFVEYRNALAKAIKSIEEKEILLSESALAISAMTLKNFLQIQTEPPILVAKKQIDKPSIIIIDGKTTNKATKEAVEAPSKLLPKAQNALEQGRMNTEAAVQVLLEIGNRFQTEIQLLASMEEQQALLYLGQSIEKHAHAVVQARKKQSERPLLLLQTTLEASVASLEILLQMQTPQTRASKEKVDKLKRRSSF